ncbi:hypothetical protein QBC35DRAFT_548714 [Podospora australis]|uniref:2EXR domain-containing protein n=1 Tax=Podospora australis TaxID=1536484 RepID=A0AAN6WKV5_9PEZI|nr:hypothetical protein QBC35DRAFT_548714 [Podospora australis]
MSSWLSLPKKPNRAKAGTQFPQFANFPPEIRQLVWEACLPRRIIRWEDLTQWELQAAWCRDNLRRDSGEITQSALALFRHPVISWVNRESRYMAFLHRKCIDHLRDPRFGNAWFDPRTDTVLLNWPMSSVSRPKDSPQIRASLDETLKAGVTFGLGARLPHVSLMITAQGCMGFDCTPELFYDNLWPLVQHYASTKPMSWPFVARRT